MVRKPTYEELTDRVSALETESKRLKQIEAVFRESAEKYRIMTNTSMDGFAVVDVATTRFLDVNESFSHMVGYSRDELLTMTVSDVDALDTPKEARNRLNNTIAVGMNRFDSRHRCKDGRVIDVEVSNTFLPQSGHILVFLRDITELKQTGEALKSSQKRLEEAMDLAFMAHWELDVPKNIFTFNDRFFSLYGTTVKIEGGYQMQADVYAEEFVYPEDRYVVAEEIKKAIEATNSDFESRLEHRIVRRDGEIRNIIVSFGILKDADGNTIKTYGVNQDITKRKRVEEDLRKSEERFRILSQAAFEGIVIHNKGYIINANDQFYEMFGYIPEELKGINAIELVATSDSIEIIKEKIVSGATGPYEAIGIKKDGTQFPMEIRARLMEYNRRTARISAISDLSERKAAEKEKKELESKLQQAQKMESIGTLAGGIAHDFNNILSSIIGFSELALDETPSGTIAEDCLQEVFSAGKRAKDLVNQILAFARQSDKRICPIQLVEIIKETLKLIRSATPTTIEIQQDIKSDSIIMGNATQVHQVLMNLCTNAIHAMEDSGGVLKVSLKNVVVDKEDLLIGLDQGSYVEIKVADTGVGIAPELIESIFNPYFTTKEIGEGTGMGLAVVHGIVKSYGGKIFVDSQLGRGTTFSICLPVIKKPKTLRANEIEQLPSGTERILFVDDESPIVKMGSRILESIGYTVTTRTSSIEALELFKSKPDSFDLVITDMTMPNLTGDKLVAELMKIRPDIPVILCTGFSKKISYETASEIGIKAFAYKPMVKADLAKTVRKVLDGVKGRAQK